MTYLLIAILPVLITTLVGRVTHRPLASACGVSALLVASVIVLAVIATQRGAGVSMVLLVVLPAWTMATSFVEAVRLRRSTAMQTT